MQGTDLLMMRNKCFLQGLRPHEKGEPPGPAAGGFWPLPLNRVLNEPPGPTWAIVQAWAAAVAPNLGKVSVHVLQNSWEQIYVSSIITVPMS